MITILLASYNGEKYIAEQIESLLAQTVRDFRLYIRDDKSTDGTFRIAAGYAAKHPDRVTATQNERNTGGAKFNFMGMMAEHKDDYVMLCDQDDVWLPDKIEKSLAKMSEAEREHGAATPILVHTDLTVVDERLGVISRSYRRMANASYRKNALNNVLTMNIASGCTTLYNRALADLINGVPDYFVIHDWWLALTAAAFGKIVALDEPTVLYRQHGGNDIGAKKVLSSGYIRYVLANLDTMAAKIDDSYKQAGAFLAHHRDRLTEGQKKLLGAYMSIPWQTRAGRVGTVLKHGTLMHGIARKTARTMILLRERRVTA
jgi:glycosyltransferase involved in cell wall biosynthesis